MYRPIRGVSLISLMVGLIIASIAVVGLMLLYKSTISSAAKAGISARNNAEWTQGLLVADMEMQGAGFGIASPGAADFVLLKGAAFQDSKLTASSAVTADDLASLQTGNAVVWGTNPTGAAYVCHALVIRQTAGNNAPVGKIDLLTATSATSCSAASDWASATWSATPLASPAAAPQAFATLVQAERKACAPFGTYSTTNKAIEVKVSRVVSLSGSDSASCSFDSSGASSCQTVNVGTTCLLNFAAS